MSLETLKDTVILQRSSAPSATGRESEKEEENTKTKTAYHNSALSTSKRCVS